MGILYKKVNKLLNSDFFISKNKPNKIYYIFHLLATFGYEKNSVRIDLILFMWGSVSKENMMQTKWVQVS